MKKQEKKILLFVIATLVTSFGIASNLLKNTYATFGNVTGNLSSSYNIEYISNWQLQDEDDESETYVVKNIHVVLGNMFANPTGYVFDGWNTEIDGSGIKYMENDIINTINTDITLYAQWKKSDLEDNDKVEDDNNDFEQDDGGHFDNEFDDKNFYKCVVEEYNSQNNTNYDYTIYNLSDDQLLKITYLNCSGFGLDEDKKISSTKGIEKLTSLNYLNLSYNLINEIDLSNNIDLIRLDVGADLITFGPDVVRNQIKKLNVNNNTKLTYLNVSGNMLSEIDLSKNTLLEELEIGGNELNSLNIDNNLELKSLIAYSNKLTEINLVNNKALSQINLAGNYLEDIDLSQNTKLESLWIYGNKLTSIDLSKNTLFQHIECDDFVNRYYVYIEDEIKLLHDSIKFPSNYDLSEYTWKSSDENIASVDENGNVILKKSGSVEITWGMIVNLVNIVELTSNKYLISADKIYFNDDNIQEIKNNITLSNDDIEIFIDDEKTYLHLKYNNQLIKKFKLINMNVISKVDVCTTISDIKDILNIDGDINILDKDDNLLNDEDRALRTGDKFKINLSDQTLIYSISVMGDVNGDGFINRDDVILSSKHMIKGNLITGIEYLKAMDMDNNKKININDIIKMVRKIKGE